MDKHDEFFSPISLEKREERSSRRMTLGNRSFICPSVRTTIIQKQHSLCRFYLLTAAPVPFSLVCPPRGPLDRAGDGDGGGGGGDGVISEQSPSIKLIMVTAGWTTTLRRRRRRRLRLVGTCEAAILCLPAQRSSWRDRALTLAARRRTSNM